MPDSLKLAVQTAARELGFALCRVATPEPPDPEGRLAQWLAAGRHGEMQWLTRTLPRRTDPRAVLAGARSVLCVGAAYPSAAAPAPPGTGFIARYARGRDYHLVLGEPLAQLAAALQRLGGADTRSLWYVDTGPLLERALAQRAGLGFIGKHTQLISRAHGNWLLLGEILTTLPLPPDAPEKNRCGHCTRCLTACPTGALPAPFTLDARRCISYLTIELKGSIPPALRPLIGNRIFGCDDCLAVCPWNRLAEAATPLLEAARRPDLAAPDLLELLCMDHDAFRRRFKDTPLERSRRKRLLRNVCVALGNVGGAEVLPALAQAAADPEPLIAEHALWAKGQIEERLKQTTGGSPPGAKP